MGGGGMRVMSNVPAEGPGQKKKKQSLSSVKLGGFSAARCFSRCHKKSSLFTMKKQLSAADASMTSRESRKRDFVFIIRREIRFPSDAGAAEEPAVVGATVEPGLF